jgi:hypothetical protein
MREPAKGERKALPEKAKFRLKVFDWYRNESPRFSLTGAPDAGLACRRFGIHRSYFCRRKVTRSGCPHRKISRLSRNGSGNPVIRGNRPARCGGTGSGSRLSGEKDTARFVAGAGVRTQYGRAGKAHRAGEPVLPP